MIIDVHTHLPTHQSAVPADEQVVDRVMRPDRAVTLTNSGDDYLRDMGPVDRAFVFGIAGVPGAPQTFGGMLPSEEANDAAAAVAARCPDKIVGFMSVHPEEPGVVEEMERSVHDLGLRGIKLGANYQNFEPMGAPARRVYEAAIRLGLPIVFHQGIVEDVVPRTSLLTRADVSYISPFPSAHNAPLRYAHPLVSDDIAMAYPELRMVLAHMGHPWHTDTLMVIRKHPNVYADVSGLLYRPWSTYNALRLAYEWDVTHKLLFASDWPVTTPRETMDYLRGFNGFARKHHLPEVSEEQLEAIIQRDSLPLLGLA